MSFRLMPRSVSDLTKSAEELAARLPVTNADLIGAFALGWMTQVHTLCESALDGGWLRAKVLESIPPDERVRLDNDLIWLKNGPGKRWSATDDAPVATEMLKRVAATFRRHTEAATEKSGAPH